ncbi:magnesium transporter [Chaetomidium leptoderma]|uniref:Magnesium transporter n=1 Tax=Chaetomidium leptoderma TaxID=669021 RepID=A0AAN6VUS5_9PEZI|nr:magnesium transporter [Chaetomidium leptoderma]
MTLLSKTLTAFGGILLAHACYSAREHTTLQSLRSAATAALTSSPAAAVSLPVDIIIETIISTFVILLGLVLGTRALRPLEWRVWAGKIEREGEEGFTDGAGAVDKDFMGNPFSVLESRPNFVDIRKQRREFTEWVQKGGTPQGQ